MNGLLLVSGLTRCGSSLLMQMLQASGFPIVAGHTGWPALEHEANMGGALPPGAAGALKWLDPQEWKPPASVLSVYLGRDKKQQAKSMVKFFAKIWGESSSPDLVDGIDLLLREDEPRAIAALREVGPVMVSSFEVLLSAPGAVLAMIAERTGVPIDVEKAVAARRRRGPGCLPYLLEERLLAERESA